MNVRPGDGEAQFLRRDVCISGIPREDHVLEANCTDDEDVVDTTAVRGGTRARSLQESPPPFRRILAWRLHLDRDPVVAMVLRRAVLARSTSPVDPYSPHHDRIRLLRVRPGIGAKKKFSLHEPSPLLAVDDLERRIHVSSDIGPGILRGVPDSVIVGVENRQQLRLASHVIPEMHHRRDHVV